MGSLGWRDALGAARSLGYELPTKAVCPLRRHVFLILFRFRLRQVASTSSSLLDRCALLDEISLATQAIREVRGIRASRFNTTVAYVRNADARAVGFRRIRRRDSRFDERIGLAELGDENAGLAAAFRAFVAQPHNGGLCAALQSHFGGEVSTDLSPPSPCRVLAPWSSFQTTCRACFEVR